MFDWAFSLISGFETVSNYLENLLVSIGSVFADIDFTVLYSWLPADIIAAITACIVILFWLALFGLLKRVFFFIG